MHQRKWFIVSENVSWIIPCNKSLMMIAITTRWFQHGIIWHPVSEPETPTSGHKWWHPCSDRLDSDKYSQMSPPWEVKQRPVLTPNHISPVHCRRACNYPALVLVPRLELWQAPAVHRLSRVLLRDSASTDAPEGTWTNRLWPRPALTADEGHGVRLLYTFLADRPEIQINPTHTPRL